jgi:ABC-type multidrug transport system fused ATPase/permease subunit
VPPAANLDEEAHRMWSEGHDDTVAAINQIESVKSAAAEQYEEDKIYNTYNNKIYTPWKKLESIWSNISFFQSIIIFATQLGVFIFSVGLIKGGMISVGELIAVNGYSAMFFGPFVQIGYSWQTFQNGLTSASHLEEIFTTKTEKYHSENGIKKEITGHIKFNDVYFDYDEHSKVLDNINLEIESGQSVALVGQSGSGKSTLVSLISKYYTINSGELTIDGIEIEKYNLSNLRKQIAIVPQEIALFNDTLENNIRYGNFDSTMEDIKKVSKEAQLESFIEEQKDGYQTIVGERGVKLSVGQKQRLAIARAMLRDPKILILDEPTSALDSITEDFVTKAIHKLMKGRTTIIVAHRLSTVRQADKIVVFKKGRIVETGNHKELLSKEKGYYKELHNFQVK